MHKTFDLLEPKAYVAEVTKRVASAQTRIRIMSMILTDDEATNQLIDALCQASRRGVDVRVAGDTFTYTEFRNSYMPPTHRSKRFQDATVIRSGFKKCGVKFHWLGRLSTFAFAGRTHIKWSVIDDVVLSFGGVNLDAKSFGFNDFMLRSQNRALADMIADEHDRIIMADKAGHSYRSHRFGDEDNMVLIDGGFIGDSIIYRRACYWAERAESILLVSQYCPTGKLSRLIKRGHAQLYFNHWSGSNMLNRLVIRIGMLTSNHKTSYSKSQYLHAKFIIFTMPDGKKVAITGSHNFVWAGVIMGTREVALETTNDRVISLLERFCEKNLK